MEWNSDQEEQMGNFKNGMLELSVCDAEDNYQDMAQFDHPIQLKQQRKNSNLSIESDDSI